MAKPKAETQPPSLVPSGTFFGRMPVEGGRGKMGTLLKTTTTLCGDMAHFMGAMGMGSEHSILQAIATTATTLSSQSTQELSAQALISIDQDIETFIHDKQHRSPYSQQTFLAAAEVAMSHRNLGQQIEFMRRLTTHIADRIHDYPQDNDVRQYLVATLMHESTDGAMMKHLKSGQDDGKVKKERGEEMVLQHVNNLLQQRPADMVPAIADYVSTDAGTVFGVPKTELQMALANNLLFANRDVMLAKMFEDPSIGSGEVEQAMTRGFEFLQAIREKQPAWFHRQSWLAMVKTVHPLAFDQMMMLVDPSRSYNRGVVKAKTYHPNRKDTVPADATGLEAYARTHDFDIAMERMQPAALVIPDSGEVPAGVDVMPSQMVGPLIQQGVFPGMKAFDTMGNLYRLNDKWGPFSQVAETGAPALMIDKESFVRLARASYAGSARVLYHEVLIENPNADARRTTPRVHDTAAEQKLCQDSLKIDKLLEGLTGAASVETWMKSLHSFPVDSLQTEEGRSLIATMEGKDLNAMHAALVASQRMFLTDTMLEVTTRMRSVDVGDANFTATQLTFLGLSLREGMYGDPESVASIQRQLMQVVSQVITGRRAVSEHVRQACEFVLSSCIPFFPEAMQIEALTQYKEWYERDPRVLANGNFERLLKPLAINVDIYLNQAKDEKHGVRPAVAKKAVEMATDLMKQYPSMHEGPVLLAPVLLRNPAVFAQIGERVPGTTDLPEQLFRMVFQISGRLQKLEGASGSAIEGFQRQVVTQLTQELNDVIYRKSPLVLLQQMQEVYRVSDGLVAGTEEQNKHLMEVFARTAGMYAQDVLVTRSNGTVTLLQLPVGIRSEKTVLSEAEAIGLLPRGMSKRAEALYRTEARKAEAVESGEEMIARALHLTATDGLMRDEVVMRRTEDVLGSLFRPEQVEGGEEQPSQAPEYRLPLGFRNYFLHYREWNPAERAIGLVALLSTMDSSKARSAQAVQGIVTRLLDEEAAERSEGLALYRQAGMVETAQAREQLVQALRRNIMAQVSSAQNVRAMAATTRENLFAMEQEKVEELARLESQLADLHLEQEADQLTVLRQQLAMRRQQVEADTQYVQREMPQVIAQISDQRRQVMEQMRATASQVFQEQLDILTWLREVYDKQGPYIQAKIQLQKILFDQTGIFMGINIPDVKKLCDMVGIKLDGRLVDAKPEQLKLATD